LKSKKTFTSDVAVAAQKFAEEDKNISELLQWTKDADEFTLIFEYTAPDARIVLFYPEPALTLLHVRQNDTGEYWSSTQVKELGALFGVPVVDEISINDAMFDGVEGNNLGEKLTNIAKTIEGVEGWVIQFEDGEMVKLKTEWYIALHRTTVFKRVRDIAELCLDEQLDDIKSAFVGDAERLEVIENIEKTVVADINHLAHGVEELYASVKDMPRKDVALKMQGHEHFSLLMQMYSGRVPAYVEWYRRHVLKAKFGLDQI
jgi:T4 RnlA family RNA ligase